MSIFTPTNQIRLTNIAVVRMKKAGIRFEIACYKNKVQEWRSKVEQDIDNVLQTHNVYTNVSKGQLAKKEDLVKAFGMADCPKILSQGDVQISDKERAAALEASYKDIANTVAGRSLEVVKKLKEIMPIERAQMSIKITVPVKDLKKLKDHFSKIWSSLESEQLESDVNVFICLVDPGNFKNLEESVREETKGRGSIEVLSLKEVTEGEEQLSYYRGIIRIFSRVMSIVGNSGSSTDGVDDPKGSLSRMKKRLTLDLEAPKSVRKQRVNELLSTPELDKLKLTTPELERLIIQQSGLTSQTVATTPSSFLNPKLVTEEEEQYVKPFEAALAQLHHDSAVSSYRFAQTPCELPPDLKDIPISRAKDLRSPKRDTDRPIVSSVMMDTRSTIPIETSYGFGEIDVKPEIKEEVLDLDYSSIGEASCSGHGSSDSNSPDPGRVRRESGVSPIDMDDQEMKKLERKRLRNRIAASKCRQRKLERISRLEEQVKNLKVENADLAGVVAKLKEAIFSLKEEIVDHLHEGCDIKDSAPNILNAAMSGLKLISELEGHKDRIWCLAWDPLGKSFATCSSDKTIRVWHHLQDCELRRWECSTVISDAHRRTVRYLSWSPCGHYLASSSFDGSVNIWEVEGSELKPFATLEGHENEVKSVAWSHDGKFIATCSRDKTVWIWENIEDDGVPEFSCAAVITSHTQDVKRVSWHPNQNILASASYDNSVKLYKEELDDWSCVSTLKGHESTVWAVDFDTSGKFMVSCSDDKTLKIWSSSSEKISENSFVNTATLSGLHDRPIYDVAWSKVSGSIATACGDNCIRIFRVVCGETDDQVLNLELLRKHTEAHNGDVNCVAWSPTDADILASVGDDGVIKIWRME
ncbi:unnamed protein product [Notodromas monacha]|uniref:Probable cytosolic iron-sulfur protein assembly protein Ciao1 n=1 Tax=Notodromas monacha TaxID=399045 RepID=A0A7R9GBA1_9CRUS|nr:unnamed protein product [Notodromas monacha]CAG0914856.1 unnamed protein product [Notodromas monacha]